MKLKEMVSYLPDIFNKLEVSNVSKLLSLFNAEYNSLRSLIEKVSLWRSIDLAEGKVLDEIGEQYGEYRGSFSDDFYCFVIKTRIAQRKADGTVNQLMWIVNHTLGAPFEEINIIPQRKWDGDSLTGEYQAIAIKGLPAAYLTSGVETENFMGFINDSVAAGIRLNEVGFLSKNTHAQYVATAIVVTEYVTITQDYNESPDIHSTGHYGSTAVVTESVEIH